MNVSKHIIQLMIMIFIVSSFVLIAQDNRNVIDNKFRLAKSYEQAGEHEKAKIIYDELLKLQPWNFQFVISINNIFLKLKQFDKSILLLNDRIKNFPNDITTYGLLGSTYYIIGQLDKACETWESALDIGTNNSNNYRTIANFAIENRAFEKAVEYLRRGQDVSRDPTLFSYDLANLFSLMMNFNDATKEYCKILIKQPLQLEAIKARILQYFTREDAKQETINAVQEMISLNENPILKELLSFLYMAGKDYESAFNLILSINESGSVQGTMIYNFAQEALANNEYSISSKAFNVIIEKFHNSSFAAPAKIGYAKTLEAALNSKYNNELVFWKPYSPDDTTGTKEYNKVITSYEELINAYPGNEIANEAKFRVALIKAYKQSDFDSAIKILTGLISLAPGSNHAPFALKSLGDLNIKINRLDKAEKYFGDLISSRKSTPEIQNYAVYSLAKINFWKGDLSNAKLLLSDASSNLSNDQANDALELLLLLNLSKSDSLGLIDYAKADLLVHQKKFDEAEKIFKALSEKLNSPVISKVAGYKYAEMIVAQSNYPLAIEILKQISEEETGRIYSDKCIFLLANIYQHGVRDINRARLEYQKILENYPNSLYLDKSREILNVLNKIKSEQI